MHVLADHADVDHGLRILLGGDHRAPFRQVGGRDIQAQLVDHDVVEVLLVQQHGNLVNVVRVDRGDHRPLFDVGEQRDLAALLVRQRVQAAAQQDIGLNADAAQFLDRVLRRLGLDLPRAPDDGHQSQMHVQNLVAAELHAHLANGLEEGERLDVADRAADFHHADIRVAGAHADAILDFIGDVRDHLHRCAEIVAAPLLGDDPFVDPAGGEIAVAARGRAHETLVMAEIEIRLGTIGRDEHLAVLKGTHGAGIHVDVRIEFHHADFQAPRLEDGAEGGGCDALAERGNDAAGDENKSSHDWVTAA